MITITLTNLLYIDDLKVFLTSEARLNRVLRVTKLAMAWNGIKRNVMWFT